MKELNFSFLVSVFKKHWWKIVAFTLIVMLGAALFTHFMIPKKYSSSVKFYVVNVNSDLDYASSSNLAAAEYLVNDYIEIINGDTLLGKIADALNEEGYKNVTADSVRKMLKSSSKTDTSVFTVSVSHTDKALAYRTAQLLEEMAPPVVTEIAKPADTTGKRAASNVLTVLKSMQSTLELEKLPSEVEILEHLEYHGEATERLECVAVLKSPVEAKTHDSPNLMINTLLAGVLAAILSYAFFLVLSSFVTTIVTENDVKNVTKKPLMAAIPHWDISQKK